MSIKNVVYPIPNKYALGVVLVGADGTTPLTGFPAALGQAAASASMPVVLASDQSAVPITSPTKGSRVAPTITAGAYSANDVVGGVLEFANAARASGGGGIIETVVVTDRDGIGAALRLYFFTGSPSSAITDNNAMSWGGSDADLAKFVGAVDVTTYVTAVSGKKTATVPNVGIEYDCDATSLYAYAVCTGTPTFTSTSALGFRVGLIPA